jgi:Fe-S oxidoreductase
MSLFVFLTQTNSIAAEYFRKVIRKEGLHEFVIVPTVEAALSLQPDFLMMTIYDDLEEYILARRWSEKIRESLPSTKLILGGPAFRSRPVAFFKNLKADYALRGEADFTFRLLASEITKERPDPEKLKQIHGIMFFEKGSLFINQQYPSLTREQLEALDFHHYCRFYESDDMVSVFTERGCPYSCTFCSRVLGKTVRSLSIGRIMDILRKVSADSQIKKIMIANDTNDNLIYSVSKPRNLFGRIIEERFHERFKFLISARIDHFISSDRKYLPHRINFDLIDLIAKAGVVKISFGTESFNDAEIKRLKPEARYSGIDAMRLTRELGKRGITVVHFLLEPSPDALPEEAIESMYRRLIVMRYYTDYIEISKVFTNPAKISLIRGSGLYKRALEQDFEVTARLNSPKTELNNSRGKRVDIQAIEEIEQKAILLTDQDVYLPFLNPVNSFATSFNPYQNLLLLEKELKTLSKKEWRSNKEEQRLETLSRKIGLCRKQVNEINRMIKGIDKETKLQLKGMLDEFGGIGRFLQECARLPTLEKRKKLVELTKRFDEASLQASRDVVGADTLQIFLVYVADAVKELVSNPPKTKQIIKKYKRLTQNEVINRMIRLRENSPLRIYTKFSEKDFPLDRPSIGILEKHIERYREGNYSGCGLKTTMR